MFFSVLFLDYNLRVSPRLKDGSVEGDRPVSNFVMSQDTCLHLSDLLALYMKKRDASQACCQRPKESTALTASFSVQLCTHPKPNEKALFNEKLNM